MGKTRATDELSRFLLRAESLVERLEALFPAPVSEPDWASWTAFRWRSQGGRGMLLPVEHPHRIKLTDLRGIEEQKRLIERNIRQFVEGLPANNVLLTGARGTGKSSLVKALFGKYAGKGLRLIEVDKQDLLDLPEIVDLVCRRPERFLLFCDDLSFDADEPGYKALKTALDGSIAAPSENVLICATSNRRHLMPEYMDENLEAKHLGGEVHPGEAVEEKISLSERFGLWVSFYPFDQDQYLAIVAQWLKHFRVPHDNESSWKTEALQWALTRGSRSGRVAWQFARDWAGRQGGRKAVD